MIPPPSSPGYSTAIMGRINKQRTAQSVYILRYKDSLSCMFNYKCTMQLHNSCPLKSNCMPTSSPMMLPLPSTNETCFILSGPPFSSENGLRVSSTWRAAVQVIDNVHDLNFVNSSTWTDLYPRMARALGDYSAKTLPPLPALIEA